MSPHYDVRLVCPITGEHEATEEIGLRFGQADLFLSDDVHRARYVKVACDLRGSHPVHDVDMSYFIHQRHHLHDADAELMRYVGEPTDDLIRR